jgi:putative membrane protein
MASDTPWLALHPASILVNLLPRAWGVIRSFWPLLLALLWRGTDDDGGMLWFGTIDAVIVGIFFALTVGSTAWHWATLRYRIHAGRLEIRTGWLSRTIRTIDPARVQNVELVAGPAHRLAGLVEVRVETASGTDIEGQLSAIAASQAEALRGELVRLRDAAGPLADADAEPDAVIIANGPRELLAYGATAGRLGAVAVLLGVAFEAITWLAPDRIGAISISLFGLSGIALAITALSGAWLLGVGAAIGRHWGFRMTRGDRALTVQSGLFTTRRLELPLAKVQVVTTSEPILRRWLGFGSLTVETAAARAGAGGTERQAATVPHVPTDRLPELARAALPDLDVDPWAAALTPPHPRALPRAIARRSAPWIVLAIVLFSWFGPAGLLAAAIAPVAGLIAWIDHRHQGWLITDRAVVVRRGALDRRATLATRARIQSVTAVQGPVLRRLGLGFVVVRVAGTSLSLPVTSWRHSLELARTLGAAAPRPMS